MAEEFINAGPYGGSRKYSKNGKWMFIDVPIPREVKEQLLNHEFTIGELVSLVDSALSSGATIKLGERKGGRSYTATITRGPVDSDSRGTSLTAFGTSLDAALSSLAWKWFVALNGDLDTELIDDDDDVG